MKKTWSVGVGCPRAAFVALDLETTGLSPGRGDRVIEVGAVAVEEGRVVAEFASLVRVPKSVPAHVSRIHGITDIMLAGEPLPEEVYPLLREFIGGRLIVAHNARFDISFLRHEFGRLGFGLTNRTACTLELARRQLPQLSDHRLATVVRHLFGGLPDGMRVHRALDDARLTAWVWGELGGGE